LTLWLRRSGLLALTKNTSLIRDTLSLAGGTALAQAIGLLVAPALTRIFDPSDFGVFSVYNSVVSILVPIASARYCMAIMLPGEEEDALALLWLSNIVAIVFGLIVLVITLLLGEKFKAVSGGIFSATWIFLIPLAIIIGSFYQSLTLWGMRVRQFKIIGLSKIFQVSSMLGTQLLSGLAGSGAIGLVWGHIIGHSVGTFFTAALTLDRRKVLSQYSKVCKIKKVAFRYRRFPLYMTWGGLMDGLSLDLMPILLALFFAPAEIGLYALTYRVVSVPISLIGRSLSNVIFQRASEIRASGKDLKGIILKVLPMVALASGAIAVVLVTLGPWLFRVVFGKAWTSAGQFAQLLAPMFFVQFLVSPFSTILVVLERQRSLTIIQGVLFLGTLGPILIGGSLNYDAYETIALFSGVQTCAYLFYFVVILKRSSIRIQDFITHDKAIKRVA
jgi:O-antigen/teichoic acid export membrane protein